MATASQLNEEGKLRESRAIGMHSDHVWKILHEEKSFISIDKNRDGERSAIVPIHMEGHCARFSLRDNREESKK